MPRSIPGVRVKGLGCRVKGLRFRFRVGLGMRSYIALRVWGAGVLHKSSLVRKPYKPY